MSQYAVLHRKCDRCGKTAPYNDALHWIDFEAPNRDVCDDCVGRHRPTPVGPTISLLADCGDCPFHKSEYYAAQGDSGYQYACHHPGVGCKEKWSSGAPDWCPLLAPAIRTYCWQKLT